MKYRIYQTKLTKKEYFDSWESKTFQELTEELQEYVYQKYVMRYEVLRRDSFKCQNQGCTLKSKLTIHHIKFQRNNGRNKARNGVTLCNMCHQGYHNMKINLVFPIASHLPPHIRGHTFKCKKSSKINWKKVKIEMKKLRKTLKEHAGLNITLKQLKLLMKFLEINFNTEDD